LAVLIKMPGIPLRLRLWAVRVFYTTTGTGTELILRFVRTVILSHLLTSAEFGVTVAIALVIFASEQVSDLGSDRFILNKSQDDSRALATVHLLQIGRAVIVAFGIMLCAYQIAQLFGVPQYTSSFMLIAIIILVRGFNHLGVKQVQREYNYRPEAIANGVSQAIALIATIAMGYILRDHRAILVAFGSEALTFAYMTHRLNMLPYSLRIDPTIGREALNYGLPLLANGLALAVITQADRLLVGHFLGVEALANYAIVLNIALVPLGSAYRIASSIGLAMLARDRDAPQRLEASYLLASYGFILFGYTYASSMALGLDIVVPLIFGKVYTVSEAVRSLVSLLLFVRILQWAPTLLLLTLGNTKQVTIANLAAGIGLLICFVIVVFYHDISSILAGILIGAIAASAVFQRTAIKRMPSAYHSIERSLIGAIFSAATIGGGLLLFPEATWVSRLALAVLFCAPALLLSWGLLRSWRYREAISSGVIAPNFVEP
jgi:O-antigen/teichoic acid export membrane protein